ncbi:hypothetical protein [Spongiactinospora sp. 9N601]|uniref:hypothetical protein n=1 Tax=Spongiactinospora sp. 9N601 TaxID=3375149 RepID=UPI0037B0C17A
MLSGALSDLVSWRAIFLINLPVVAVALVLLPRLVPKSRAEGRHRLDVPGAVLVTGAAVSLVYGLLRVGESDWSDPVVIGAVGVAALALMGYGGGLTAGAVCVALGALLIVVLPPRPTSRHKPDGQVTGGRSTPTTAPS